MSDASESRIKKVLFNEISFIIALIGIVSSFTFWITNPQNEMQIQIIKLEAQVESNQTVVRALEKIKNNDFVELHEKLEQIEARQIEVMKAIAVLESKL